MTAAKTSCRVRGFPGTGPTPEDPHYVPVSDLRAGDRYCMFDSLDKYVALLKVTAVSAKAPVTVTFSATRWKAPEPS
ncbi:hypothetical protein JBE04_00210 [Streptomyces sp. PRKS01-29]|nr:hypothetical protein [Streptomyces sabulosicollis]MBI0292960.1 hypothetical protein [Streptomyces sabulosicollis]